ALQKAGWRTGYFGKWHLARENDARYTPGGAGMPETQGFDDVLVTAKPASKETAAAGADPDYDAHHARAITDRAVAFIRSNKDRPFFCYIAHNLIHRPEMEYAPAIVKYAQKSEAGNDKGNNPVLGAMVETLDKQIGRILTALDELGLADNTVVVFFSDNGDFYGRERHQPFHGHKADLYEGGIRMPLIVRWPNAIEAGSESDALACSIDFLPTFAELAGVPVEDGRLDGVSLVPVLCGGARLERDTLFWHYPHYHSIGLGPSGAIRKGKYKLIEWFEKSIGEPMPDDALELYDLESDPGERHNLASIMPEKTRDLHARLRAWRRSIGAQEMELNPNYDPARAAAIAALM
ncbi:MAG TPA: sulfatase-like hydrolase/transferase, partial [Candidatus Hydrogenedentes bacterium]|nr:sulfatase-like hydrolase/transferase [Candidatus Hydrogenedentota bacterium]